MFFNLEAKERMVCVTERDYRIKERLEIVERVNRPGGPLNRREPHFEGDSGGGNGEVKCKKGEW